MIITDIRPQIKREGRYNIFLDNAYYCGLDAETVLKNALKIGREIEKDEIDAIQLEGEKSRALDKALDYISRMKKTEKAVRDYLKKKGYTDAVANYCLEKMKEYSYIDDADYADSYLNTVKSRKGLRLIKYELKSRGVSEAIIDNLEEIDESEAASDILKKYVRGKDLADTKTYSKAYRHLLSKGFSYDSAKDALEKLKSDFEEE